MMHATAASYIQYPSCYPLFSSYTGNHHYFNDLSGTNTSSNSPNSIHLSSSLDDTTTSSLLSFKKRSRTVPAEEKDGTYYEKRACNNESAKRSRDARRIKEQQIQERVTVLEYENSRLLMENQAIRYQLSHLHALSNSERSKLSS